MARDNETFVTLTPDEDGPVTITHPEDTTLNSSHRRDVATHFETIGLVGRGGMGDVHLVRDPDLGRAVALKVMKSDNEVLRSRFLTEAQVTAQLDHPNVVPIYALEDNGGMPAFTMKFIRGRTLKQLLKRVSEKTEQGLALAEGEDLNSRLELFAKVCDAMAYSHARGVIHRDLKPDNIMVGAFGEVYVMDWGIAKVVGFDEIEGVNRKALVKTERVHETRFGAVMGTPSYMSPEQAQATVDLTPKSDQYALGLILQELVTLERSIDEDTAEEALLMAQDGDLQPIKRGTPRDLAAIISKATEFEPDQRYSSVHVLGEDVRRYLHQEETIARPDNLPRAAWRWARSHPTTTITTVLATVLTLSLVAVASLLMILAVQQSAAVAQRANSALINAVARRTHDIDNELLRYQSLLDGVAVTTTHLWVYGQPHDGPIYDRAALRAGRGPRDWHRSDRYKIDVTYQAPLTLRAPGVDWAAVEPDVRKLLPLNDYLRSAFLRTHSDEAALWAPARSQALLESGKVPPAWLYIGLANGVLINYPGLAKMSPDYDPRKRPWFQATKGTHGPRWGEPYPDDTGYALLIGVNQAMYEPDGSLIGVVGLDADLDTVIAMMDLPGDHGVVNTYFVDGEGRVLVDSAKRGAQIESGTHDNKALDKPPFPDEAVRQAIVAGLPAGHLHVGDSEVVFNRMDALGWYYVVRVE